jgi:hypothetical protein
MNKVIMSPDGDRTIAVGGKYDEFHVHFFVVAG